MFQQARKTTHIPPMVFPMPSEAPQRAGRVSHLWLHPHLSAAVHITSVASFGLGAKGVGRNNLACVDLGCPALTSPTSISGRMCPEIEVGGTPPRLPSAPTRSWVRCACSGAFRRARTPPPPAVSCAREDPPGQRQTTTLFLPRP